jgi:cytochrome P450
MGADHSIDPTKPSFFTSPDYHQVLAHLRAESPLLECAPGFWTVALYNDIRDLSRDPEHFCSGQGALINDPIRGLANPLGAPSLIHMDPPEHSAFRGLLNRRFTPRALSGMVDSVRRCAIDAIEAAEPNGEIDFVAELSAPFPLAVIAELLGIEETDRGDFRRWSDAAIESTDLPPEQTLATIGELAGFIGEHLRVKRSAPGNDLVSVLIGSEVNGCPLSTEELFIFLMTLLVAGNETTRTLLSGAALALAEHPEQRASLAAGPHALMAGAVEESLRWVTPIQAFCRTATEDMTFRDQWIKKGDYLCMLYASGNRDETVFGESAGTFDIGRPTNPMHVAFGFGEHVCLGASLARMEGRIFLEELLARYPNYEVTGPAARVESTTVAGIHAFPVVLAP